MDELNLHIDQINSLCQKHGVNKLYAFGSVLSTKFNLKSDVDLIVDFNEMELKDYADNYFALKFSLEKILKRNIDLLEEKAIKNPYFREVVNSQRQLIYGHSN